MTEFNTYFITWTTYGAWLPGDPRGWSKYQHGEQRPRPDLEKWCQIRMLDKPVLLTQRQKEKVELTCRKHAKIRHWMLHAVNARSNHIHVVVAADADPEKVRNQFKAYATRVLRQHPDPITNDKIWTRGGDIKFIKDDRSLEDVILYVTEAQDRMDRGK